MSKTDAPIPRNEALVPLEEAPKVIEAPSAPPVEKTHRRWPWVVGIGVAVLLAVLLFLRSGNKEKSAAAAAKSKAAQRTVPVVGAVAKTGNLDIYLTGLGTVTALNTVTVRSRVAGQLIRVSFKEGPLGGSVDLPAEM